MHHARVKTDCPNVLFWDHTRAIFMDDRGLVPDNSVSLLSRGVTFGHSIVLVDSESVTIRHKDPKALHSFMIDDLVTVPLVEDHIDPEEIREPRYRWTSNSTHPKILMDTETGATCYFSPSLNVVRSLGPDFDGNPLNYQEYEGFTHCQIAGGNDDNHTRIYW